MPADRSPVHDAVLDDRSPRAYALPFATEIGEFEPAAETARRLGFDRLLALAARPSDPDAANYADPTLRAFVRAAHNHGLLAWTNLSLDRINSDHQLVTQVPAGSFGTPPPARVPVVDPRSPVERITGVVRLRRPDRPALLAWWLNRLARLRDLGFDGFVQLDPDVAGLALADALADHNYEIVPFHKADAASGTIVGNALVDDLATDRSAAHMRAAMAHIALHADGWALATTRPADLAAACRGLNDVMPHRGRACSIRTWTGAGAPLQMSSRPLDDGALLLLHNRGPAPTAWPPASLPPLPWQRFCEIPGFTLESGVIAPGQTWLMEARALAPVCVRSNIDLPAAVDPARRVVISRVSPSVDGGAYAAKTVVGDVLDIEAHIFADGHEQLRADVLVRALDETEWIAAPLRAGPNDVWTGSIRFSRVGRHELIVQAWLDAWGGFARDLAKKRDAGQDLALEIREARALIAAASARERSQVLAATLRRLDDATAEDAVDLLLTPLLAAAMQDADERPFMARSFVQPIEVEREAARFASWYEMFPRSQGRAHALHGTFADVVDRLPHIARMGFDTLYFPPIHPIGQKNRKGRNNAIAAMPDDVGSPYAIGSSLGGHDAVHPQLGTLADFRALVAEAQRHRIEIALDFAIQCAPDHPWLREHHGWFAWRPDGSLKYAENPPKKYQDIVNVDFYASDAVPDLWQALRDVVLFWIMQGVRIFRVDNPHTKPLPFWQWMIADVKARFPETLFLSEAFTRPKPMYHLAKIGFSQSYTYFTWRNTKADLTEYLTELTQTDVRDYFRPHFFVNTPDINPIFLQNSGRAGFLIRAALAATLSGLWGMYAGFELCESAPLPGREEYLDSEKYEIRHRPDRAPGDIVDEITQLNHLRRSEPALQTHLGVRFHNAFNDNILYFAKSVPGHADQLLIAVSLDPHASQEADFEVPLWQFGLSDGDSVAVSDLLSNQHFQWTGKIQHMRLTPDRPYAIWRITSERNPAHV